MRKQDKVAVLGPEGTFTGIAAKKMFPGSKPEYCDTVDDVFRSVEEGADYGVVAIENSLEGSVNTTMDCLMEYDIRIYEEFILDIHLCMMVPPNAKNEKIKTIWSHSHSLGQCRKFLKKNFPDAALKRYESNTAALKELKELRPCGVAAVGPESAAELYGLAVIRRNIEDAPSQTRFIAISKKESAGGKTSIIFILKDRPGALYQALKDFADQKINLTKIESRPSKKKLGEYSFYVDFEGSPADERVRKTLEGIREKTTFLKMLGSYGQKSI
ncbi:MAG: prephenate dehydratase [Candidatus Altiarchaeota archaeon]|nr:prephenate dehydratase [Candidatus Altiarchaeota archaeon]